MTATVQSIDVTVEAAFGDDPLTAIASNTWTNITAYVRDIGWRRGRSHSLDSVQPGSATIVLSNADRRFDPLHSAGPYYGDLKPNVKVRVTVTHDATVYRTFTGYVDGWPQSYQSGDTDAECTIRLIDASKILGMDDLGETLFSSILSSLNPRHWWRLDEAEGSRVISDHGSGNLPAKVNKAPHFGTDSLVAGESGTATSFRGLTGLPSDCLTIPSVVDDWSCLFFLFRVPSDKPSTWGALGGYAWSSPDLSVQLFANATGDVTVYAYDWTESTQVYTTVDLAKADRMHSVMVKRNTGTDPDVYIDGIQETTTPGGAGNTFGTDASWIGGQDDRIDGRLYCGARLAHVAIFDTDVTTSATALHNAALDGNDRDATGARIGRVLDIVGWPTADRDIDTGVTAVSAAPPGRSSALGYMATVETSEQGLLFMGGDGQVKFIDRAALGSATRHTVSQGTFSDDGSDSRYMDGSLEFELDDSQLRNECTVSASGGDSQTAGNSTSQTAYGKRSESLSTFIADHRVSKSLAEHRVLVRKDPVTRPAAFTVKPERDPAEIYPTVLGLEIGDRITVERTPQAVGSQISLACVVDSIGWQIPRSQDISVTITASPVADVDWFTLGSSLLDGAHLLAF